MRKEQLTDMEKLDIRTVKKESLVDLKDVKIDKSKSKSERIEEFIEQVKKTYSCICDRIIVKMKSILLTHIIACPETMGIKLRATVL